jgi:hypothetical protein
MRSGINKKLSGSVIINFRSLRRPSIIDFLEDLYPEKVCIGTGVGTNATDGNSESVITHTDTITEVTVDRISIYDSITNLPEVLCPDQRIIKVPFVCACRTILEITTLCIFEKKKSISVR